jgi:hypothetical protein
VVTGERFWRGCKLGWTKIGFEVCKLGDVEGKIEFWGDERLGTWDFQVEPRMVCLGVDMG